MLCEYDLYLMLCELCKCLLINHVLRKGDRSGRHTIDNLGPVDDTRTTSPIHRSAPTFIQLDTKLSIFETGTKVVYC